MLRRRPGWFNSAGRPSAAKIGSSRSIEGLKLAKTVKIDRLPQRPTTVGALFPHFGEERKVQHAPTQPAEVQPYLKISPRTLKISPELQSGAVVSGYSQGYGV
jgi:hypothetical protein